MISACPEVIFTCSAMNLPTTIFRWFFNDDLFARYEFDFNGEYPLSVQPVNATYSVVLGGVNVQMVAATLNDNNQDIANFISTMTVDILTVQEAGVTSVSCGSNAIRHTLSLIPTRG